MSDVEVGWARARALRPCKRGRECVFVYARVPMVFRMGMNNPRTASGWESGDKKGRERNAGGKVVDGMKITSD